MTVVTVGASGSRLWLERSFDGEDGAFALFNEPAGEHGRGVLFEPLIEEFGDLLPKIGSVGQARELVGLERGARSREQEFPGSLGTELRHKDLQSWVMEEYKTYVNIVVIHDNSNQSINRLWKGVEKQENGMGLCSGCAGDYEDPDWSAWEEDAEEEEGDSEGIAEGPEKDAAEET
jgi:hypothetical protein